MTYEPIYDGRFPIACTASREVIPLLTFDGISSGPNEACNDTHVRLTVTL